MFEKNEKIKGLEAEITRLQKELDMCSSRPMSSDDTHALNERIAELEAQVTLLSEINKNIDDETSSGDLIVKLRDGFLPAKAPERRRRWNILDAIR